MSGEEQFFQTFDNTLTCGWNPAQNAEPLTMAFVKRVEFGTNRNGNPVISVTAAFSKRLMRPEDVQVSIDEQKTTRPLIQLAPSRECSQALEDSRVGEFD